MIRPLRQRSSWPSSFATALIGWVGFAIIDPLALGYAGPFGELFLAAALSAAAQTVVLRAGFFAWGMNRSFVRGAVGGGISAIFVITGTMAVFDVVRQHPVVAVATALYAGIPVGAFLSYFYRDDRSIEAAAKAAARPVDYGRDAHWLDPFVYGAAVFTIAFLPRSADVAVLAAVVGMIVGVIAAGVSHFVLSGWGNAPWTIALATVAGAVFGAPAAILFRRHAGELVFAPLVHPTVAGALTFAATAAVGRLLAIRERAPGTP